MSHMRFPLPLNGKRFPVGLRVFQDSRLPSVRRTFQPPLVTRRGHFETEYELALEADVPEIEMKDIDLQVENGTLTLMGERKFEQEQNGRGYHRIERGHSSFVRAFTLPDSLDVDKAKAQYKSGVLTVTLSTKEVAKRKIIRVEINNN